MNNKKISHNFNLRVKSIYDTLKSAEKRAMDAILDNPTAAARESVVETAKRAQCSDATLTRLSRKLGFKGYSEMKSAIFDDSKKNKIETYDSILETDNSITIIDKVFSAAQQAIEDTRSLIDVEAYLGSLEKIVKAKKILFVGVGDAYIVAYSAYLKFSRIGCNASCTMDFDIQLIEASKLTKDDVIVVVSHSGETASIYEVALVAKKKGAGIISITNYPRSSIAAISDHVLLTAAFTPNVNNEIMAKRIPELAVIETLYVNTLVHGKGEHRDVLTDSNTIVEKNKL